MGRFTYSIDGIVTSISLFMLLIVVAWFLLLTFFNTLKSLIETFINSMRAKTNTISKKIKERRKQ